MADAPRRVALVTGGAGAVGTAIAAVLERDGWCAVVTWHHTPVTGRPSVRCDVRDEDSVAACIAEVESTWGPIDVVVACAGLSVTGLSLLVPVETFDDIIRTDLVGAFLTARVAARTMVSRRSGRIVFIGSVAALWGVPGHGAYSAAKAGMIGLARSMARELGGRGITVNVVAPGLLDNAVAQLGETKLGPGIVDRWVRDTPLRRVGTVAEAAEAVAFLAAADASFMTGVVLPVDGGFAMGFA